MTTEPPLVVDFVQDNAPQILPNLPLLSSHRSSWRNIHLAHHRQPRMDLPELYNPQHIVIIPLGHRVVDIEFASEGRLQTVLYEANDYTKGCIQIFPADLPYKLNCNPEVKQVEFIHCYLEPTFLAQVAHEAVSLDRVELLLELKKVDRLLYEIGFALKADLEVDGIGNGFYADSLATAMAAHLLRHYSTRKHLFREYEDGLSQQNLQKTIEYINEHLNENLFLSDIANELEMSQYYFCRLFKQSTGVTPHKYLMQQRVERAKQLLKQPELTVTEVAIRCGFSHQSHLAKYFRLHTGVTPTQFRQLH